MRRIASLVIGFVLMAALHAHAATIYAGFPPPGGVSTFPTGSPGSGGSRDYFGFDGATWSDLYFGYETARGPLSPGVDQALVFNAATLNTLQLVWDAPLPWMRDFGFGPTPTPVRMTNSFYYLDGSVNITSSVVSSASVPITPGPGGQMAPYVLPIDDASLALWGGGFQSSYAIEGFFGGVWTPVLSMSTIHSGGTKTQLSGAFWYEPESEVTAVPEPASMMLVGTGLLGLVKTARSRRRDRKAA